MDAAKDSIKKFMSKDGQHSTTVHEGVAPAVTNETVNQTQHEKQTTAVDREVHQHHHHTTEQPISHQEVLPEQHHHKAAPVVHREFDHGDNDKLQRGLEQERGQYRDTQSRVEGEKTRSENPVVQGEHVHHHVHETIQPVVQKQTIEPHVVHSTVPIHEVHHNEAHHHAASALPAMSMDDFKKSGGSLGGRDIQTTHHKGELRSIGGHAIGDSNGSHHGTTNHAGTDDRTRNATTDRIGDDSRTAPSMDSGRQYGSNTGSDQYGSNTTSGLSGDRTGTDGHLPGSTQSTSGHTFGTMDSPTEKKKPSLMDRINPKKDADGDGKAGFMK